VTRNTRTLARWFGRASNGQFGPWWMAATTDTQPEIPAYLLDLACDVIDAGRIELASIVSIAKELARDDGYPTANIKLTPTKALLRLYSTSVGAGLGLTDDFTDMTAAWYIDTATDLETPSRRDFNRLAGDLNREVYLSILAAGGE